MAVANGGHAAEGSDETAVSQPTEGVDGAQHEAEPATDGEASAPADPPAEDKKKLASPKAGITKPKASLSVSPSKTSARGPPTPLVKKVRALHDYGPANARMDAG